MPRKATVEVVETAPEFDFAAEAKRLLDGGAEGEYTLIPTASAADNHTVVATDTTITCELRGVRYTLCKKA